MLTVAMIDAMPPLDGSNESSRIWKRRLSSFGKKISISTLVPIVRELVPKMAAAGLGATNHFERFDSIENRVACVRVILVAIDNWMADPCDATANLVAVAMPEPSHDFHKGLAKEGQCVVHATEHLYQAVLGNRFAKDLLQAYHYVSEQIGWANLDRRVRDCLRQQAEA